MRASRWLWLAPAAVCAAASGPPAAAIDLLRNDQVTLLEPLDPPKAELFTGGIAGCSPDPSVTLDAADPTDCSRRTAGEGARTTTPGSDDADDLYVLDFDPTLARPDPERGVLTDPVRRLVLWQLEGGGRNDLRLVKDLGDDTVLISAAPPTGACCRPGLGSGTCEDGVTEAGCSGFSSYGGDGSTCATSLCWGQCCTDIGTCYDALGSECLSPMFDQFIPGSRCEDVFPGCCLGLGECYDSFPHDAECCLSRGGTTVQDCAAECP